MGSGWHVALFVEALVVGIAASLVLVAIRPHRQLADRWIVTPAAWGAPAVVTAAATGPLLAVPDTEGATVLLGAAAGITLVCAVVTLLPGNTVLRVDPLLPLGALPVVLAAERGAAGRAGPLIGGAAAGSVVVLAPLLARCLHGRHWRAAELVLVQLLAAVATSRLGGVRASAAQAIAVAIAVWAMVGTWLWARSAPVAEPETFTPSGRGRPRP